MMYLLAYLLIMVAGWLFGGTYASALLETYASILVLLMALLAKSRNDGLLYRSVLALFIVDAAADLIMLFAIPFKAVIVASIPAAVLFFAWLIYLLRRQYDIKSQVIQPGNIGFLFLRPRTTAELIKAFFGIPVSSLCIVADGYVYSFRAKSGKYERMLFNASFLEKHIAIDTHVKLDYQILHGLQQIVGESRFPPVKCVWSVRHVLNLMGGKYAIRSWFDYIPGVYAMRVMDK